MDLLGAVAAAIEFIYNAVTAYAATPQGEADIAVVEAELTKLGIDLSGITGSHTSTPTTQTPAQRAGLAK